MFLLPAFSQRGGGRAGPPVGRAETERVRRRPEGGQGQVGSDRGWSILFNVELLTQRKKTKIVIWKIASRDVLRDLPSHTHS